MLIRKNARWLTPEERQNFLKAVLSLKAMKIEQNGETMRQFDFYPLEHRIVRRRLRASDRTAMNDGGHRGPGFFPWHRQWLLRFERDLRAIDSSVTLPYWDITDHSGTVNEIFQPNFMGTDGIGPSGRVRSGYFRREVPPADRPAWWPNEPDGTPLRGFQIVQGLTTFHDIGMNVQPEGFNTTGLTRFIGASGNLPDKSVIRGLLARSSYFVDGPDRPNTFSVQGEGIEYHVPGHNWVGGLMSAPPTSPNDPIFFLHHAGVDLVWALWQSRHRQDLPENLPPSRATVPAPFGVRYGHFLEDFMWPWDGTAATNSNKAMAPASAPLPPPNSPMNPPIVPQGVFERHVDPNDTVRVADMINRSQFPSASAYQYDVEIPYRFETGGTTLAWIEPYLGDMKLTGVAHEQSTATPSANDLTFTRNGNTLGWISAQDGDLHVSGSITENTTRFSDAILQSSTVFRHYNQPLAYFDSNGEFQLKGRIETNQPPLTN